jgi:hypothetical protein
MERKSFYLYIFFCFIFSLMFVSCDKEIPTSIPNRDVFVETNPYEFNKLQIVNNAVSYIPPPAVGSHRYGFGGLVIYRGLDEKLRCYDLACPVEALPNIRVDINPPFAVCPQCNSRYDLNAIGSPVAGPARESLRNYNNIRETGLKITVHN